MMEQAELKIGDSVEVEVLKIQNFGAIVKLCGKNQRGLIHISQVSNDFVKDINAYLKVGDKVTARVKKIGEDGKIDLSLRTKKKTPEPAPERPKDFKLCSFHEKMDEFLKRKNSSIRT